MPQHHTSSRESHSRSSRSYNDNQHRKVPERRRPPSSNDSTTQSHRHHGSPDNDAGRSLTHGHEKSRRHRSPEGSRRETYGYSSSKSKYLSGGTARDDKDQHDSSYSHRRRRRSTSRSSPRRLSKSKRSKSRSRPKLDDEKKKKKQTVDSPRVSKKTWKFDSPPRDEGYVAGFNGRLDMAGVLGLSCEQQKAARELYVGNLPPNLDVNQLIDFFNAAMLTLNSSGIPGNPVSRAWIAADGHFAFVEFRTIDEATIALQLNGLNCMGYTLRIGRPKTYPVEYSALLTSTRGTFFAEPPTPAAALAAATAAAANVGGLSLGIIKKSTLDKPDRLILLDLPPAAECPENKINELLLDYGPMRVFQYFEIPQGKTTTPTGVCIFEYMEKGPQTALLKAVSGDELAGMKVRVMPAEEAIREGHLTEAMEKAGLKEALGGDLMKPQIPTRVIMLTNIVTRQELLDKKEYFDIVDDISIECAQFGTVKGVEVPRPDGRIDDKDIGNAYIKFAKLHEAGAARKALSGRKFSGRTVEAHYFDERLFNQQQFRDPQPNFDLNGRLEDDSPKENPEP